LKLSAYKKYDSQTNRKEIMRVHYEWHFEKLEQTSGEVIDFSYAPTLNILFRHTPSSEVREMIDKNKNRITIQKWGGTCDDDMEIIDYAYVEPDYIIVGGTNFGILPKRFQIELDEYFKEEINNMKLFSANGI